MRKIEKQMIQAIQAKLNWKNDNTQVIYNSNENVSSIFLHGNHIADYWQNYHNALRVNEKTLSNWPTPTTKSRLRALGANVTTKNGVTFLDGVAV